MGWFKQLCLSWIILAAVACQDLRSTLREGNRTCPGEEVNFTCTIRDANLSVIAVAWSSTEYIGQGGSLQLSTANVIGHFERSIGMDGNITATATVTNKTNVNGELILETMLRITAVLASTVTCRHLSGGQASIGFIVSAVPGVPQGINAAEISRPVDNICVILVTWSPPANSDASDINHYIVHVPSRDIILSSTLTTITVPNCGDDIRIHVAAVNRIGCVGMNSSEVLPVPLDSINVPATTDGGSATTTEGGSASTSSQLSVGAAVGITVAVILPTLFFLGLVFFSIYCVCVAGKCTGKPTEMEEALLREVSTIRQVDFQKDLVNFYTAVKKDLTKNELSSMESLSQMMENPTVSKRYIKEAVTIALQTIKLEEGEDVKNVLIYLKKNVPSVLASFDKELKQMKELEKQKEEAKDDKQKKNIKGKLSLKTLERDQAGAKGVKGTNITMANLIHAAEQNQHEKVFDELIGIMDKAEPEIIEGHLRKMFEELQKRLSGGEVNIMESPTS